MASDQSVSRWLQMLQDGQSAAAQPLWERYFHRLVGLARAKLQGRPKRVSDEEDVALSVFANFCQGVEQGRFPQLADRDDLWSLLVTLTEWKSLNLVRDQNRQKRGGGMVCDAEAVRSQDDSTARGLDAVPGREPTPEFAAQVAEECCRLLDLLGDSELRSIAVWKMECETVPKSLGGSAVR